MSNNGNLHRGREMPQGERASGGWLCCNRCSKPVSTTVFVCACFCLFCEECTVEHFQVCPNCPVCGRTLTEKDFMDLLVTDPPAVPESIKPSFQKLLRKKNASLQKIQFADMSSQFIRQYHDLGSVARFLLKQMVESTSRNSECRGDLERELEASRQENIQLKQAQSARELEHQALVGDLQNKNQALQQQVAEKENVINKFRRLHGGPTSPHATMIPASSHSHRSSFQQSNHHHGEPPSQQQAQAQPPLQGFMAHRAAEERSRHQVLQSQLQRGIPILGGHSSSNSVIPRHSSVPSGITPIQVPRRSFTSNNSPGVATGGSGVRNLTSSAGYSFTSRTNHHHPYSHTTSRRTPPVPAAHSHLSPTMAFARNHGTSNFGSSNSFEFGR